jgi:hypothetical protein
MATKQIWTRLSAAELAALDAAAKAQDRSRASLIAQMIRKALASKEYRHVA